jgi:hypothetical protein
MSSDPVRAAHSFEAGPREPVQQPRSEAKPPHVRLGQLLPGGLAPAIVAIVERGALRRPGAVRSLRSEIELRMTEGYPPVRIVFGGEFVLVQDGPGADPELRIEGALPDLASLMAAPMLGGVPVPINGRGRAALATMIGGRVRVEGRLGVMRRFLEVIRG